MHCWIPKVSYINPENEILPISLTSNHFTLKENWVSSILLLTYDFLLKFILSCEDIWDLGRPPCAAVDGTQRRRGNDNFIFLSLIGY